MNKEIFPRHYKNGDEEVQTFKEKLSAIRREKTIILVTFYQNPGAIHSIFFTNIGFNI